MTWIDVDAEKLRQAAASLRETKGEVQALADYAHEADPDRVSSFRRLLAARSVSDY